MLATLPGLMMGCDLHKVGEALANLTNADWNGNQIPKVQSRGDGKEDRQRRSVWITEKHTYRKLRHTEVLGEKLTRSQIPPGSF